MEYHQTTQCKIIHTLGIIFYLILHMFISFVGCYLIGSSVCAENKTVGNVILTIFLGVMFVLITGSVVFILTMFPVMLIEDYYEAKWIKKHNK